MWPSFIESVFVSYWSVRKDVKVERGQNAMRAVWSGHSGSSEEGSWEGQGWVEGCLGTSR